MSRIYENPNQAIYDRLTEIHAEAIQTNNLLNLILETLRMYLPVEAGRKSGESTKGEA